MRQGTARARAASSKKHIKQATPCRFTLAGRCCFLGSFFSLLEIDRQRCPPLPEEVRRILGLALAALVPLGFLPLGRALEGRLAHLSRRALGSCAVVLTAGCVGLCALLSGTAWVISRYSFWYSALHITLGSLCAPLRLSVPYSVKMSGRPCRTFAQPSISWWKAASASASPAPPSTYQP